MFYNICPNSYLNYVYISNLKTDEIIMRGCVNHILHVAFFGKNDCVTNFSQQFPSSEISPQSRKIIPQANFYHFKLIICRNEWLKAVCFF